MSKKVKVKNFVELITMEINQRLSDVTISFDEENFALLINSEDEDIKFNLGNVYNDFIKATSDERDNIIYRYINVLLDAFSDIPETLEDIQKIIFPRVRNSYFKEEMELELKLSGEDAWELPSKSLANGLIVTLVINLQHSLRTITIDQLKDWDMSFENVLTIAKHNLLNITPDSFDEIGPGSYMGYWKDSHTASRILFPQILKKLIVKGDFVVLVPTRDYFLITGSDDVEGLMNIANIAQEAWTEEHRTLTGFAYRLENETWHRFLPPKDHPSYYTFKLLASQSLHDDYCSQKELIEKIHDQKQIDIFIASFKFMQEKGINSLETYSTWSEGIVTLLPKSDLIALYKAKNDETILCRWEDVESLVDDIMIMQEEYDPIRYLVENFPDDKEWKTLKSLQIKND